MYTEKIIKPPSGYLTLVVFLVLLVGGIYALSQVEDPHLYSTYFMKIDNVRFKQKVVPGDTVVFELILTSPIRRGLVEMSGTAYVNGKVVSEASMLAQIIKDKAE